MGTQTSDETIAASVDRIVRACLYTDEELTASDSSPPDGAVLVEGIVSKIGFHPQRLEAHREEIRGLLGQMPKEFHKSKGGGMSALNMCNNREGRQWGEHRDMDLLVVLGLGVGMVEYLMPREMWAVLPGGMPYILIDTAI